MGDGIEVGVTKSGISCPRIESSELPLPDELSGNVERVSEIQVLRTLLITHHIDDRHKKNAKSQADTAEYEAYSIQWVFVRDGQLGPLHSHSIVAGGLEVMS